MFKSDLILKVLDPGYLLMAPLEWDHEGYIIEVPAGFLTDLASIPRVARWLFTGHGKTRKPAVLHDYLYYNNLGERKDADLLFRMAMKAEGMSAWRAQIAYRAVRIGGWAAWNSHQRRKENVKGQKQ